MEIIARICFKTKNGWKRAKYSYYTARDVETIKKFAEKAAKARRTEFDVQTNYRIGLPQFSWRAVDVFDLDNNCVSLKVVDGI